MKKAVKNSVKKIRTGSLLINEVKTKYMKMRTDETQLYRHKIENTILKRLK